jgi:hypothetical protein
MNAKASYANNNGVSSNSGLFQVKKIIKEGINISSTNMYTDNVLTNLVKCIYKSRSYSSTPEGKIHVIYLDSARHHHHVFA